MPYFSNAFIDFFHGVFVDVALVVEVGDLIFGFDLTIDEEKEIAVKIVTQSYPVVGVDGKHVDVIVGGWLLAEYGVGGHLTRNVPR